MSMKRTRRGTFMPPHSSAGGSLVETQARPHAWGTSQPLAASAETVSPGTMGTGLSSLASMRAPLRRWRPGRFGALLARGVTRLRNWLTANTFHPNWLPGALHIAGLGYVVAALLQAAAVSLDMLLVGAYPVFRVPGLLVVLVVVLVALNWGVGPSLLATLWGAALLDLALLQPDFAQPDGGWVGIIELLLVFLTGVVVSMMASQTERARRVAVAETAAAEAERQEAEGLASQLTATLGAMADAIVIYDGSGRVLRMNLAARELLALEGQTEDTSPSLTSGNTPSGPATASAVSDALAQRGNVLVGAMAQALAPQPASELLAHANTRGVPVRDASGRVVGSVSILRDAAERRLLERRTHDVLDALLQMAETLVHVPDPLEWMGSDGQEDTKAVARRMAELARSVLGCQRIGVIAVDPQTQLQDPVTAIGVGAQELFIWGAGVQGRPLSASYDAGTVARLCAGDVLVMELDAAEARQQAGAPRVLLAPMRIGERLVGYIGYTYDAEEHVYTADEIALAGAVAKLTALALERGRLLRERAAAHAHALALEQTTRRMDEFLAIASHEIKTPLTVIKANAQLLARRLSDSGEGTESAELVAMARQLLDRVERQSGRLQRLVQDLLDSSRISSSELELRMGPCDLAEIVRGAVREQLDVAPGREIRLESPPEDVPVPVVADADRIRQVVLNVLSNALKYSPKECPVAVTLRQETEWARVAVYDQGLGLPEWEHERVWERFYRAPGIEVQAGSGVGLGLGLYISRTIVERHGGTVGVQSAPGAGSTFWFALPLAGTHGVE